MDTIENETPLRISTFLRFLIHVAGGMCLEWGGGWCYGDAESFADDDVKRGRGDVRVSLRRGRLCARRG